MKVDFLDLKKVWLQNEELCRKVVERTVSTIHSGRFLLGPNVKELETKIAAIHAMPPGSAVGVSNGLDALRLIFKALMELGRLRSGDEIIVPANTYIASLLPLTEMGLKPRLVEPDPQTMNLDWNKALNAVNPSTKGVLAVHLYGNACWNDRIASQLRKRGIIIVEDNAQAIGATHNGKLTGSLGDASAFSFYPTKNIGALGDAGLTMSRDPELTSAIRALANYGSDRRYHNIYQGYNCRMDEIQAGVLSLKLDNLDSESSRRRRIANLYDKLIDNSAIKKPLIYDDLLSQVWHQYVVRTKRRDAFVEWLASHGISTDIHYAVPPHLQPCYSQLEHGPLPITELLADEVVSLPIATVTKGEVEYVARVINSWPG